ncbi:MAG: hypothetical protein RMI94_04755 [Bryobacterales bacterium]|nr:hypothetical protein [Bryobacterales bacterium]
MFRQLIETRETRMREPVWQDPSHGDGGDEIQPEGRIFGPKVMIINEFAGSGGDAMPWYFRLAWASSLARRLGAVWSAARPRPS